MCLCVQVRMFRMSLFLSFMLSFFSAISFHRVIIVIKALYIFRIISQSNVLHCVHAPIFYSSRPVSSLDFLSGSSSSFFSSDLSNLNKSSCQKHITTQIYTDADGCGPHPHGQQQIVLSMRVKIPTRERADERQQCTFNKKL